MAPPSRNSSVRQPVRPPPPPPPPPRVQASYQPCSQCHSHVKTFICIQCNKMPFCDACWSTWMLHADGATGWDGRPHEKSDPHVITRLREILEHTPSDAEHEKSLELDDDTTWFGVVRDPSQQQVFQDYGRFASLMSESQSEEGEDRFPQLVSFIGQTGAGKSTLIKILIERAQAQSSTKLPSPITSSSNDRIATTGDVHLYAEPSSFHSPTPMLLADCEGLNGGERVPRGLKHRTFTGGEGSGIRPRAKLKKSRYCSQRNILWASTPEMKKREFSVMQLYPRLLYTFSDVVVFVLRNPRAFESTLLEQILGWGAASIDKSVNQPTLPHAVIVLNATDDVDEKEWDIKTATQLLMDDIRNAIRQVPQVEEHARIWRQRGRHISSTHDLLKCYYASVSVVRVPARGRYMLMDDQVQKLFELIQRKCEASLLNKKRLRMLATAEKLQIYLQAAFDHFAQDLRAPFDFIKEALKHNPVPRDLGGNILKLALFMQASPTDSTPPDASTIFTAMSPMLASCFHLDSVRQNFLGTTERLLSDVYIEFCKYAVKLFSDLYLPCEFENPKGRCCNKRLGHRSKGHQNQDGRSIAPGSYQSSFQPQQFLEEWLASIRSHLQDIEARFDDQRHQCSHLSNAAGIASEMHLQEINRFYQNIGGAKKFLSHETCLACLREMPEHALPCGHVLCNPCVLAYGKKIAPTAIMLETCPLHHRETFWQPPWQISVKPPQAGVRILCLDGGGFRGIVSLLVLRQIERFLGPELPLQSFFDLIVGTSTGGIIALGLGVNNWSVAECIQAFRELCHQAFTPRELRGVPVLEHFAVLNHGSMYKTRPLEQLLKEKFDRKRPLFGGSLAEGPDDTGEMATKVAVTSTISVDQHAVVISNYNRPESTAFGTPYRFQRAPDPDTEMKVWEAARATAAAPPFFKPYEKPETKDMYIDGALYHNCPVWVAHHEKKLIWGDVSNRLPDLLVSVGTGFHKNSACEQTGPLSPTRKHKASKSSLLSLLYHTSSGRLSDILNCNRIWDSFLTENAQLDSHSIPDGEQRYVRINPDLGDSVPRLDDVSMMEDIERKVAKYLWRNQEVVKETAHRLIASTFFFETDPSRIREVENGFWCQGRILCRFLDRSEELKALGRFLQTCVRGNFEPYFVIQEQGYASEVTFLLAEKYINMMCLRGSFELGLIEFNARKELSLIHISLCLQDTPSGTTDRCFPISGFPRELVAEGKKPVTPPTPANNRIRRDLSGRRRFLNVGGDFWKGDQDEPLQSLRDLSPTSSKMAELKKGSDMFITGSWETETEPVYELEG